MSNIMKVETTVTYQALLGSRPSDSLLLQTVQGWNKSPAGFKYLCIG